MKRRSCEEANYGSGTSIYFREDDLLESDGQESGRGEKSGESNSLKGMVTGSVPMTFYPHQSVINALPGEPYRVLRPIPVIFEWIGEEGFLARFEEANIQITGDTPQDAFQNLVILLLDTFEDFSGESDRLGPEPARQLSVLRKTLRNYA